MIWTLLLLLAGWIDSFPPVVGVGWTMHWRGGNYRADLRHDGTYRCLHLDGRWYFDPRTGRIQIEEWYDEGIILYSWSACFNIQERDLLSGFEDCGRVFSLKR